MAALSPVAARPAAAVSPPSFANYYAPDGFTGPHPAQCIPNINDCDLTGEPSIGVDRATGKVMMQQWLTTARLSFDDSAFPPTITWEDVSPPADQLGSLDAILFTDRDTNRTFVSQLDGACSITEYSDNDGNTWLPSQGCGVPAGPDHQTIGGGPVPPPLPVPPLYPNVVYYCSQGVVAELCAPSFTGGTIFNPSQKVFDSTQCEPGLFGHLKVSADGTAYVPIKACDEGNLVADTMAGLVFPGRKGLGTSFDAGLTPWTFTTVPDSYTKAGTIGHDPSVATGADNALYYGYTDPEDGYEMADNPDVRSVARVAVSHDHGATWTPSADVSSPAGLNNVDFVNMVAGDDNRAALAFLGTSATGHSDVGEDVSDTPFPGVWYLYVAFTYDGGATWTTVNATPDDPVQRGCITPGSGAPCRNMLDFNDATVDREGRVLVAYTDGCHAECETDPTNTTRSRHAGVVRQTCGPGLFAAFDQTQAAGCFTPASNAYSPAGPAPLPNTGGAVPLALVVLGLGVGVAMLVPRRRARA
ncbi:MAG: hypothetical protein QOE92_1881 [Chloroflexota bacterium]|jgi:hypothetical protein|nr:hypothetical protein [Chloroflexota bacterium]